MNPSRTVTVATSVAHCYVTQTSLTKLNNVWWNCSLSDSTLESLNTLMWQITFTWFTGHVICAFGLFVLNLVQNVF